MKVFIVTQDTRIALEGAVLSSRAFEELRNLVGHFEFRETTIDQLPKYTEVWSVADVLGQNDGERNVFHDASGNEWRN